MYITFYVDVARSYSRISLAEISTDHARTVMSAELPLELWTRIFSYACTDDGRTGCSISLVSRYFRDASLPVRLQCVFVSGPKEMSSLADMLERRSTQTSPVRHLCMFQWIPVRETTSVLDSLDFEGVVRMRNLRWYGDPNEVMDLIQREQSFRPNYTKSAWRERYRKASEAVEQEIQQGLLRVLRLVAPTLQTLTIVWNDWMPVEFFDIGFPRLLEFTLLGNVWTVCMPDPKAPSMQLMPALERLHLTCCCCQLQGFENSVPALTHLRVSWHDSIPSAETRSIIRKSIARPADGVAGEHPAPLPRIERILLSPPRPCADDDLVSDRIAELEVVKKDLNDYDAYGRLSWLPFSDAWTWFARGREDALADWMDRINGGEGCWRT